MQAGEVIPMVAITFAVVSASACLFLCCVFFRFHQELERSRLVRHSGAIEAGRHEATRGEVSGFPKHIIAEGFVVPERVFRRNMLVNGVLGLFGVAAPFIFMLLVNFRSFRP